MSRGRGVVVKFVYPTEEDGETKRLIGRESVERVCGSTPSFRTSSSDRALLPTLWSFPCDVDEFVVFWERIGVPDTMYLSVKWSFALSGRERRARGKIQRKSEL
jgi:hypothetical protein